MRTLGVSAPARARPLHAHNEPRELPGLHRLGRYFYASLRVRSWQADRFCPPRPDRGYGPSWPDRRGHHK
jgi:hypothetical protein